MFRFFRFLPDLVLVKSSSPRRNEQGNDKEPSLDNSSITEMSTASSNIIFKDTDSNFASEFIPDSTVIFSLIPRVTSEETVFSVGFRREFRLSS